MIDISTSITTMGLTNRTKREGGKLPGRWLLSADGQATDDPNVVGAGGTLLPVGGLDHGHKGFGLGLLVEMLTQGLSGYGRADGPSEWGASVLVLAIDPEAFGGGAAFLRQSGFIAQACRDAKPLVKDAPVRLPGAAGLARKRRALAEGVALSREIVSSLTELSRRLGIAMPAEGSESGVCHEREPTACLASQCVRSAGGRHPRSRGRRGDRLRRRDADRADRARPQAGDAAGRSRRAGAQVRPDHRQWPRSAIAPGQHVHVHNVEFRPSAADHAHRRCIAATCRSCRRRRRRPSRASSAPTAASRRATSSACSRR